jgi:hypothetical protein
MRLTNNFVQSKMNKDTDERLLPKGQYPHAENIRVANSDGSDVGAIENAKGNEPLTQMGLTNAATIGSFADGSNQKLYWFVTSDEKDLVMEYDVVNSVPKVLLESTKPDGVLNFNREYLITGVTKVLNGDSQRDLLVWTDNFNPIRKINIERAKTYSVDGFSEDDISLIKKPPRFAPTATLTYTSSQTENNIEDNFFSFSYRYKYLDGEYSALSSYTNYKFSPEDFQLDYQTMENEGMVNSFNAVKLDFNTGDKTVTDLQLVLKESNSNALAVIETFNKSDEGWADSTVQSFVFANSKKLLLLADKELFRPYDNVPLLAKSMELISNRLVFGNYLEGYDLVNTFGTDVVIDYELSLINKDLAGIVIPSAVTIVFSVRDTFTIDFTGQTLKSNSRISLDLKMDDLIYSGTYNKLFSYITNKDFATATELAADLDFVYFVEEIMTNHFIANYENTPPANSSVVSTVGFKVSSSNNTLSITSPSITYSVGGVNEVGYWSFKESSSAAFREIAVNTSLKTNRSYEVGIIYLDPYGRATTVITDTNNTINVPQKYSAFQNVIVMNLNSQPPAFADRYKIVVKQNKAEYQTIYTNVFYEDGLYRWVKLEGANKDKVKEGMTLIVKSDLGGVREEIIKVRVLEVTTKTSDFIEENENSDGNLIIEEGGLYMKIKSTGFDMNFTRNTSRTFEGSSHERRITSTFTNPSFGEGKVSTANFVPYKLGAGSSVRIFIEFQARGAIAFKDTYDKTFRASSDYNSIQEWFDSEVVDLGSFGTDSTQGFGFSPQGEQFFVRNGREGTATRSITTTVRFEVLSADGVVILETESDDIESNVYYETEQTFEIIDGYHQGNLQNQSLLQPVAMIELDFFNCYAQGNGAESYRYKDTFNSKFLNIDLRPSATSVEKYKAVRRLTDLTYSAPYNENTNINGLNEFNLATLNYKEDIDKKYGSIQKLYAKDTDLLVFQEDKVSRVLYGKDLLMNADGSSNITSTESILGQQIPYAGEFGISRNPESFAFDANQVYFTDAKRGAVCRLGTNGIVEISMAGMVNFFKEAYKGSLNTRKLGAYDPYYDQYILHNADNTAALFVNLNCSESYFRNRFIGSATLNIDYGLSIGDAGFNYSSNGLPVKYDVTYNGITYSTGYVGDSAYNSELAALGLPPVSGTGNGSFVFSKSESIPRSATVTITAPIANTNFQVDGNCIVPYILNLTSIVLNGLADSGLTIKSRYKWGNNTYSSPFKTYSNVFEDGDVDVFDLVTGGEGTPVIPLQGSTIEVQSYKGFSETGQFLVGDRIGYLISDTLYQESDLETIVSLATFVTVTESIGAGGDTINSMDFNFNRTANQNNLYVIWDYRGSTSLVDDSASVQNGGTVNINVLANDTVVGSIDFLNIFLPPNNGTAVVELDNSITYVHDGSSTLVDQILYQVDTGDGNYYSAYVNIVVLPEPLPEMTNYSYEGFYELNDPAHPNGGSLKYVDINGVQQTLAPMWSGTCTTFASQSPPTDITGTGPCTPASPPVEPTPPSCVRVEWNLQGITEDTFVSMNYDDCSNVNQSISGYVGELGTSIQLVGLENSFFFSHGTVTII